MAFVTMRTGCCRQGDTADARRSSANSCGAAHVWRLAAHWQVLLAPSAPWGWRTRVFEAPLLHAGFTGLRGLGLAPAQTAQLKFILAGGFAGGVGAGSAQEPHLVLPWRRLHWERSLLQRLHKGWHSHSHVVVEDHEIFDYWKGYAPLYDVFAVIQKEQFLSQLAGIGQGNALYLHRWRPARFPQAAGAQ